MKCSKGPVFCQWLCLIIILFTTQISLGAIPSFVSPLEDGSSSKSIPETTVIGTSIYSIEALDSDDQTGASITYDIVSQVPAELFELSVEDRTTVETTGEFDFETGVTTFTLTFSATTTNGSVTTNLTVIIDDVNDESPQITGSLTADIEEELNVGTVIPTTFTATDNDTNDVLRYSLKGDSSYFDIDSSTGNISVSQVLDYDTATQITFNLLVTVRDAAGHTATQPITVNLLNINDNAPVFINALADGSGIKNIPETMPVDTSIYKIEAEDADGDTVSVDLVAQTPADMFTFDGTTLRTTEMFDFETGPNSFTLTFDATSAGDVTTAVLTVNVEDVNDEVPQITGQFTVAIDEEQPVGTVVPINMTVVDEDAADTDALTYSISGDDSYFSISSSTGEITTTHVLDYDAPSSKTTFTLSLTVRDTVGHAATQEITIHLNNIDDNKPLFISPKPDGNSIKRIPESTATDMHIYTIEADDADGESFGSTTYDLISQSPEERFQLFGTTVLTDGTFDYESGLDTFTLTFRATSSGQSDIANLTVIIEDVNDETPVISGTTTIEIDEELDVGTVIEADITATDADAEDAVLTYSLRGDDLYFNIGENNGELTIAQVLDYEDVPTTSFELTLSVRDKGGHVTSQLITINLRNLNDNTPVFVSPLPDGSSTRSIPETTAPGTSVYNILATDADGATVSYAIADQDPPGMFTLSGLDVTTIGIFDYESGLTSFTLTINATSEGDATTAQLTINIEDENDEIPTLTGPFIVDIDEDVTKGTLIPVSYTVDDADQGDVLRYSISGNNGYFEIDSSSGEIRASQLLDYDTLTQTTFQTILTVRDAADHFASATITINLKPVNDNSPIFIFPDPTGISTILVPETTQVGTVIYNVEAEDADGDDIDYELNDPSDMFVLVGATMRTKTILDFESGPSSSYTLTFSAISAGETATAVLTVRIQDENDNWPIITGSFNAEIDEEEPEGTFVPSSFSATDADAGDVLRYTMSGNDARYFSINHENGDIRTSQVMDYESMTITTFHLTVTVSDQADHESEVDIAITLRNINDNALTFISPLRSGGSSRAVPETITPGTEIYTVESEDADGGEIKYVLVSQEPSDTTMYNLIGDKVFTAGEFDYENGPRSYTLTFNASTNTEWTTAVLTVHITDENDEIPAISGVFTADLNEEVSIGTSVPLTFTATDADEGDVLRYSLSGVDSNKFDIDTKTGIITTKEVLDYDTATKTSFALTVTVTDKADHSVSQEITINLIGINDHSPEFSPIIYYASVQENTAEGSEVVELTLSDADGDTITLSIAAGDNISDRKFQLVDRAIQTTSSAIDYESLSGQDYGYTLSVTATDGASTATATVYISVNGENEHDPVWATFNLEPTLAENALIGTTVLTVSASDEDKGSDGLVKYTIDSISPSPTGRSVDGLFHLDEKSGVLTTKSSSFDRDIDTDGAEYYDIVVKATDREGQGRFITETVRVTLTDVNDNRPMFSETLTHVVITEVDAAGTVIQDLIAIDADQSSALTYHLDASSSPSSYSSFFAIEELNKLKLISAIDLDDSDNSANTFHLVVIVKDGGSPELSGTTTILVTVTAVNEYPPVFGGPYSLALSENTNVDTDVHTVNANDADSGADGQVTYSIEAGDPDNHFSLDPSMGVIKLAKSLDFETKTQHILTVKASDGGSPNLETTATVTINILDENDNLPTCDEISIVVSIPENRAQGDSVTHVSCDDKDTDTVSYRIKSGGDTVFGIDSAAGEITLLRAVDYDAGENFFRLVIGVDSGPDSLEVTVAVTVTPVNEDPPVFNVPDVLVLSEDAAVGTTISSLKATDQDIAPHDIVKYEMASVTNGGDSLFSISKSTGVIRLIDSLDYEALPSPKQYILQVLAIDGGTPTAYTVTGTLTVSVQDVNDNYPECTKTSYTLTLAEDEAVDYVLISDFGCSDRDEGTILQYALDQNPSNFFRLVDAGTRQLVLDAPLNYDTVSSYNLLLTVSDGAYNTEVDIDIVITDVNNGPPVFPQTQYTANIPETANVGTSIITILATDPDAETSPYGKLVYTLIENPGLKFNIDPNEGTITLAGSVNAEELDEYNLVIQAAEEGGQNTETAACVVTINDVNDNEPTCSQYSFSISINELETAPVPKAIYTLNCNDKDISASVLQYSLASGDVSLFEMNQTTLQLIAPIDYEQILTDSYEVVISVSDGDFTVQVSGVIVVTGENEYGPVFNPGTYQVTQAEDTALSSTIVTVSATDGDRGETVTYSLVTTVDEFKIEPSSGGIILVAELDRESTDIYELVVQATDGMNIATATVSITVIDVNDHTPTFSPASYSITISENTAADQSVTTVSAVDHDDPTGPGQYGLVQYSLMDTFDAFKIDQNTGKISTTVKINYEEATFYTLTVRAVDSNNGAGAKSSSAIVTVMVTGINEHAPVWADFVPTGTEFSIPEDIVIGYEIVTLSATDDDDGIHGVVFYTIDKITTSPAGRTVSGLFHLDQVTGKLSTTSNAFDRDVQIGGTEYYDIDVKATDQEYSADTTIRVRLTDVNDNMPVFSETVYNVEISEEDAANTVVKVITATDADETTILSYVLDTSSLPSSYDSYFTLDVDTIKLKAILDLDPPASAASTFHLVVLAKDGGNPELTGTTTVIVSVKAVNEETPTFAAGPYIVNDLSEGTAIGDELITVVADDSDYGSDGVVTYTITGGDPDSQFSIHPSTGKVKVAKALDYERKTQYELIIEAKDEGGPPKSSSTTLTINLLDESDSEPTCMDTFISVTVLETYLTGDQVAELSCDDDDVIDTIQYGIKSGDTTAFQIDPATGVITLKRDMDYDEQGDDYFELVIGVQGGDDSLDVTVSVTVSAVNEFTPNFTENNVAVQVSENEASGKSVVTMEAHDGDSKPHDIIRYSISSVTNGGSTLFAISKETGVVRLVGNLNYETLLDPKEYVIKVLAVDGGAKTGTGTLTVSVLDENDNVPVCLQTTYVVTITESTAIDTEVISDFGCTDADEGTTLTYSLSQAPLNHFRRETTPVARLLVDAVLNFDANDYYTLTLSVSDGQHITDLDIDIIITDTNNGGPTFDKSEYTRTVSETASTGTSVVTVSATDPDAATSPFGQLVYSLIENSENRFNIDPDTGKITVAGNLDAEDSARFILIVKAAEKGGLNTATAIVNVTIIDENDNEPECQKYSFSVSVPETSSGDLTTLVCTDKDITGELDYSISEGDTTLFQMNQNVLQLVQEIDYDTSPTDTFVVVIDVSDGSNAVQVSGMVTVTAENEHLPTFTEGTYQVSKAENTVQGSTIVKLTATDPDKDDIIEFALVSPSPDDFSIDKATGEIIVLTELDRERQNTHELIINALDGQHTATATVVITVTDVNDHTPTFQATSYSATVPENELPGYDVISVSATDLDDPNTSKYGEIRYYISNANDAFVIDASSGEITTIKSLDYEDTQTYTIFIQAIDSNGGSAAKSSTVAVTIQVENVNEYTPAFDRETYSQSVPEDKPVGTLIVHVSADDSDSEDDGQVVYTMPNHNYFYLNSETGKITLKSSLDYESPDKTFVFEVVATDSSVSPKSSSCTVSISVSDINDNEPRCEPHLHTTSLPEDSIAGTFIAQLTCSDADSSTNAELVYVVASVNNSPPGGTFSVDTQGRLILGSETLDYETEKSYSILVRVSDNGAPTLSSTATIKLEITDINEYSPAFDEISYVHTVSENFVSSVAIIRVQATDQDTDNTLIYYFEPESNYFEIDRDNGDVFIVSPLDYEALGISKSVELIVFASDSGVTPGPKSSSTTVTISVQNTNDGTPIFTQGVYFGNLSETSIVETTVLRVAASDSDGEQPTYAFEPASATFRIEQTGDIVLHDNSNLDYDIGPKTHKLIVLAEDQSSRTGTATVYIRVLNENEHQPVFSDFDRTVSVNEDAKIGDNIITISASDDDDGDDGEITYEILSGADGKFSIDKQTGQVTVSGSLDREIETFFALRISALDGGIHQRSIVDTLNINIIDINDVTPSCEKQLYSFGIPENTTVESTIITLICTDGDNDPIGINNAIGNYFITEGNTDEKFELTPSGEVKLKGTVDREVLDSYSLIVIVADTGVPALTTTVTLVIKITDVNDNDPIFDQDNYLFSLTELSNVGYSIGTVHSTDLDVGDAGLINYQILTGNEAEKFAIDERSGEVALVEPIDFDTGDQSFTLKIAAVNTDGSERSSVSLVAIQIQDENDNKPTCSQLLYTASISENIPVATDIIEIDCDDIDTVGNPLLYTIVAGNDSAYFNIGAESGNIFVAQSLDAETVQHFELIVDVTDGTFITSVSIAITIIDINEHPPIISPVNTMFAFEDTPVGTILYTLTTSDADISETEFTYTITGGDPDQHFTVGSSSGEIQLYKALDRESVDSYVLTVQVIDGLGADAMSSEIEVTFIIEDANDNYPLCDQTTYTVTLPENSAGQVIVTPDCSDADIVASPMMKYQVTSGNDDGIFAINENTGQIDLIGNLDYETKVKHELICEIDDQGNPSNLISTISVIVHVDPINEFNPQFIEKDTFDVAFDENTPVGTSLTQIKASDDDKGLDHGTVRFSISNGNINNNFAINSVNGVITLVKSLDYETVTDYSLTVTAKDSLGAVNALSADFFIHINVNDVNDVSPQCSPSLITETHDEDFLVGNPVAQLQCSDGDTSSAFNTLYYNIISINGDSSTTEQFSISVSGIVTLESNFDYEQTMSFSILIKVSDSGLPVLLTTATVELTIDDVNEHHPSFEMPAYSANLKETTPVGNLVHSVKANDDDVKDAVSYYFEPKAAQFEIDSVTGEIYLTSEIDYDVIGDDKTITLTVFAKDDGDNPGPRSSSVEVTITIVNENDGSPVFMPGVYTAVISENQENEDTVTTVTATDIDDIDFSYFIISGNEDNVFRIDKIALNGVIIITDNTLLDYETINSYSLVVHAVDAGGLTGTTTVAIEVTGCNEFVPKLNSLSSTQFIPENSEIGHSVIDLDATDDDQGADGEIHYTITSGVTGKFAIDPTSGLVTVAGFVDREETDTYLMEITVADKGVKPGPFSVIYTMTVSIVDENDISPVCTSSFYSVSIKEDVTPGTIIAQINCSDGDVEPPNNEITTYIITNGNEGGAFIVSTSGQVSTAMALDYETKHYYELVFEVSDSGIPPLTTTTTLGVTVADENDNPPLFTANPYVFEAPEDTILGTSVGHISASDADIASAGEMIYTILSGNEDSRFALDRSTGILYVAKALDYDTDPKTYTLVVRASDRSALPLFDTSTIQFSIRDVNDQQPVCSDSLYSGTVPEDAPFQTSVITVVCDDADSMDTVTYSIIDGNIDSVFIINENTGLITVARVDVLDIETLDTYDLTVEASDGTFAENITVVISVNDVNDIPPAFIPAGPFQVDLSENSPIGHTLVGLDVTDGDITPAVFTYSIASGNEDGKFKIGSMNGVLQLQREVDRDVLVSPVYNLEVTVTDGIFTATAIVNINVLDENDNYVVCDQVTYTAVILETTVVGSTVFAPDCTDPDSTTDMHFEIVSGNEENKFLVDEDDGKLKLQFEMDYETMTSYTLMVTVSDQGTPSLTTTLLMSVFVGAVNEHKPELYGNFNVSIYEDAPINQVVVSLYANDSDIGLNHADITYAIKSGNNEGLFNIHPSTGLVTLVGKLDYEKTTTHILTVTATDMSPGDANRKHAEEILTIHVLDVNDNYPTFDPQVYAIELNEDTPVGTTVVKLTAADADSGLAGTNALQFNIIQGNEGNAFSLSDNAIVLDTDVDSETVTNYILVVSASDQGVPILSSNTIVSIYVKAVNEYTPVFSISNDTVSVDESISVGELVYQLVATDDDTGIYSELRYFISTGNTGDAFTVDLYSGTITVAKTLDFEVHPDPYVLQIEVEDTHKSQPGITRTSTMTLTVILNDVNDEIPIFSQNTYTPSINENIVEGTRILTVTATDKDTGPNGEITYQIVAGNGITVFSIDSLTGAIKTQIGSTIDYETTTSYDLIVQTEDNGIPKQSSSCLVHITVLDLNDEIPEFEISSVVTTILEEKPIDTFLTSVVAIDKDSLRDNNNVFTYSFSEASANFRIDQNSGDIYTTAILDRETVFSHTLVVYAIDQGPIPNTGSTTVNVQVVDINDNPPEISGIYDTTVSEDAVTNTAVFIINASDRDAGENKLLTYSITDGNIDGDFKIDSGTGYIQVMNTLDRERTNVYYLEVTVADGGTPPNNAIRTAKVTISDKNDNKPIFDHTTYRFNVSEEVPINTIVGRVTATDADIGLNAALRYMIGSFTHGDSNHFKVDAATGVISTSGLLDREIADTYVFIYRAFDGGTNVLTATATVSITVGDFDDQIPEFGNFFYSAHTLENQPVGTSILTVVTSDNDFGQNAVITLSIDTKTTQGVRADEFIAVDSSTSILSVKKAINRETDTSFEFILIATDGGAMPLTATATVSIIVDDENDERPAFSPTYYNAEIAYNDNCAVTVTTLSATDKDYGVNAEFKYRFTLNPVPHLFRLEERTGEITLLATAAPGTKYILYAEATDAGSPPLTSNGVTIRIDTFTPNDHVISFNLGISEDTYLDNEEAFLNQLSTVFRLTYPTATVKRWCFGADISDSEVIVTQVHLYVVKNNLTDTEAFIDVVDKEFLTSNDAFAVVSADDAGSPSNNIKVLTHICLAATFWDLDKRVDPDQTSQNAASDQGSAWDIFEIVSVEKYFVEDKDETPFFQTAAGVAIVVLIVLLLVAAMAVGVIFLLRKARKHNWLACLNQIEHGEDDGGDHVARNQYLTKTYEKKPLPPIGYYDKSNLPSHVVALPMPSSTKKVPLQVQNQIYERPKDMHIYNDLIGFRPGSGVGSRLMKHPERLRSGSPASSSELPPIRKLSSLVSRPPTFAPPIRDVSLREETPRAYDDSMRTIDDETASLSTTKEFDGRAVDPVTGRVYEYSTRTHERRWVNESETDSHFKLKTEEK